MCLSSSSRSSQGSRLTARVQGANNLDLNFPLVCHWTTKDQGVWLLARLSSHWTIRRRVSRDVLVGLRRRKQVAKIVTHSNERPATPLRSRGKGGGMYGDHTTSYNHTVTAIISLIFPAIWFPTVYNIAGKIRERKLSRVSLFCAYQRKFFSP